MGQRVWCRHDLRHRLLGTSKQLFLHACWLTNGEVNSYNVVEDAAADTKVLLEAVKAYKGK
jgi:hypothetical protein